MIEIELKDGQSGYEVIEEYIRAYWKRHILTDVIISIGTSYDGNTYNLTNEIASPMNFNDIEFRYDWWEGEKFIRLFGIRAVDEFDITGGIYTKE